MCDEKTHDIYEIRIWNTMCIWNSWKISYRISQRNGNEQKKGKFRIVYSPKLEGEIVEFYELLLNPTIKAIVIVLLKSENPLSQIELVSITEKSNPSISRGLKQLLMNI